VFGSDPTTVANAFAEAKREVDRFERLVFAVYHSLPGTPRTRPSNQSSLVARQRNVTLGNPNASHHGQRKLDRTRAVGVAEEEERQPIAAGEPRVSRPSPS
jgi:hypothetical protein